MLGYGRVPSTREVSMRYITRAPRGRRQGVFFPFDFWRMPVACGRASVATQIRKGEATYSINVEMELHGQSLGLLELPVTLAVWKQNPQEITIMYREGRSGRVEVLTWLGKP